MTREEQINAEAEAFYAKDAEREAAELAYFEAEFAKLPIEEQFTYFDQQYRNNPTRY